MLNLLLGVLVYVLTAAEGYVAARQRSAEMLMNLRVKGGEFGGARQMNHRASRWALKFEVILCVWLFVGLENKWLMLLAIPASYHGQWWSGEKKIRRAERKMRNAKSATSSLTAQPEKAGDSLS